MPNLKRARGEYVVKHLGVAYDDFRKEVWVRLFGYPTIISLSTSSSVALTGGARVHRRHGLRDPAEEPLALPIPQGPREENHCGVG